MRASVKRLKHVVVGCTALLTTASSEALTGNQFRMLSETQRQAWVAGAVDGVLTAQLMLTNQQPVLVECLSKLEVTQQRAIFEKALEADPERWHFPAAFKLWETLHKYCGIK